MSPCYLTASLCSATSFSGIITHFFEAAVLCLSNPSGWFRSFGLWKYASAPNSIKFNVVSILYFYRENIYIYAFWLKLAIGYWPWMPCRNVKKTIKVQLGYLYFIINMELCVHLKLDRCVLSYKAVWDLKINKREYCRAFKPGSICWVDQNLISLVTSKYMASFQQLPQCLWLGPNRFS